MCANILGRMPLGSKRRPTNTIFSNLNVFSNRYLNHNMPKMHYISENVVKICAFFDGDEIIFFS